jgi:hypothetical protein
VAERVDRRRHIVGGIGRAEKFTSPRGGGGSPRILGINRARHGTALKRQLDSVAQRLAERGRQPLPVGVEAPRGFYLAFESPPGFELKLDSLENDRRSCPCIQTPWSQPTPGAPRS